jgi:hypothetical protein
MGRQFFWMSTVGPPNRNPCISTSKNNDINNKRKQNYPNYQMQMMLLKPVYTTSSGRITANTTNWRAAQYQYVGQVWWNYVCQYSAVYIYNVHTCKFFFIIKVYFPNLVWVGHENFFVRLDGL